MEIRTKTIRAAAVITLVLVVAVAIASHFSIRSRLEANEEERVRNGLRLVRNLLDDDANNIGRVVEDWACWTDVYDFMGGENADFAEQNLTLEAIGNLGFDFVLFFDPSGDLTASTGYDRQRGSIRPPSPDALAYFAANKTALFESPRAQRPRQGVGASGRTVFLAAIRPILNSAREGEERGSLVMGYVLDDERLSRLSRICGFTARLFPPGEAERSARTGETVRAAGENGLRTGSVQLTDIAGRPGPALEVSIQTDGDRYARPAMIIQTVSLLGLGASFLFLLLTLLEKNVFSRLRALIAGIGGIERAQDLSLRLEDQDGDEFSQLARSINAMLGALERAQQELIEARERYQQVLESQNDLICRFDENGIVTFANAACGEFLGQRADSLLNTPCPFLFEPVPPLFPSAVEALTPGSPLHSLRLSMRRPNGESSFLDVAIRGLYRTDGALEEYQFSGRDVTASALAEERLRLAHAELESLFSSISSVLVWLDGEDRVLRWNAGAELVFGVSVAEAAGRPISRIAQWDAGAVEEAFDQCRNGKAAVRLDEVRFVRADGKRRLLGMTVNPAPSGNERPGVLILAQDITEIKSQEDRRSLEMKMQSIGRLAAGIAHEINTPVQYVSYNEGFLRDAFADALALITLYRELLDEACQALRLLDPARADSLADKAKEGELRADLAYLAEEIPKTVENSLKGLGQVARIVSAMREFSHPGEHDEVALDINSALENTVTISRNEWKRVADVKLELADDLPLIYGHPQDLNQVFLNLLVNAAQAVEEKMMADGGEPGEIHIRSCHKDGMIEASFTDTGPGVPEEIRSRIFEPFFTTKPAGKGTGQGLAITHALVVERYGGEILLEDRPGGGSIFTVRLPERGPRKGASRGETRGMA